MKHNQCLLIYNCSLLDYTKSIICVEIIKHETLWQSNNHCIKNIYRQSDTLWKNLLFTMFRWTRSQSLQYLKRYTLMSTELLEREVDRYITWPGQACSYKIGELKFKELREKAEGELGKISIFLQYCNNKWAPCSSRFVTKPLLHRT